MIEHKTILLKQLYERDIKAVINSAESPTAALIS